MKTEQRILKHIGQVFLKKHYSLAVAESVTAGLLQFKLSNIPDASKFFQGGITAFNIAQKFKHLNVEPSHAIAVNCVSQKVAEEMATNVARVFNSSWSIGITGYASPAPESDGKLFAYFAICQDGKVKRAGKISSKEIDPPLVQEKYALFVLGRLAELV